MSVLGRLGVSEPNTLPEKSKFSEIPGYFALEVNKKGRMDWKRWPSPFTFG